MGNDVGKSIQRAGEEILGLDPFDVFSISLRAPNTVFIIDAGQSIEQELMVKMRNCRNEFLSTIDEQVLQTHERTVKWNVGGQPFSTQCTQEDQVVIRALWCEWLRWLRAEGWQMATSTDVSSWIDDDLSTCYFAKAKEVELKEVVAVGVLSHHGVHGDSLLCVNADQELLKALKKTAGKLLDKAEPMKKKAGVLLNLKNTPFARDRVRWGEESTGRELLMGVLREFHLQNFSFLGAINLAGQTDTLFFERTKEEAEKKPGTRAPLQLGVLSLHGQSDLRLHNLPVAVVDVVRKCLKFNWQLGINKETKEGKDKDGKVGCVSFSLNATPWSCVGATAHAARLLCTRLLHALLHAGWTVHSAIDMSRKSDDKSTLYLTPLSDEDKQCKFQVVCMAPVADNQYQILNLNEEHMQSLIAITTKSDMKQTYTNPATAEEIPGGHQWTLFGTPWMPNYEIHRVAARHTIGMLLAKMNDLGWQVLASAAIASEYEGNEAVDVHSIFMYRKTPDDE